MAYAVATRTWRLATDEHRWRRDITLSAGSLFLAALCWYELPSPLIAVAWGIMALLLLEIANAIPEKMPTGSAGAVALFTARFRLLREDGVAGVEGRSGGVANPMMEGFWCGIYSYSRPFI